MTVRLSTGYQIDSNDIVFDPETYHFFYGAGGMDITNTLLRTDKVKYFSGQGFDVALDNVRLYNEKNPGAPATGATDIWTNFWGQITTDPLAAPLDSADQTIKTFTGSITGKLVIAGLVAGALFYFRDDLKDFFKR